MGSNFCASQAHLEDESFKECFCRRADRVLGDAFNFCCRYSLRRHPFSTMSVADVLPLSEKVPLRSFFFL